MKIGKLAAVAVLSVASAGFSASVLSAPVSVDVRLAPPAPRHEIIPVERAGYIWAPGYWDYRHNHYSWVAGHWERERAGYYYSSPAWVQQGDHWVLNRGSWERGSRDRPHDGIPNRYDHDRDNDGVPDYRDHHPDNPHRN